MSNRIQFITAISSHEKNKNMLMKKCGYTHTGVIQQ